MPILEGLENNHPSYDIALPEPWPHVIISKYYVCVFGGVWPYTLKAQLAWNLLCRSGRPRTRGTLYASAVLVLRTRKRTCFVFSYYTICGISTIRHKNDDGHHAGYNYFWINASQAEKGGVLVFSKSVLSTTQG